MSVHTRFMNNNFISEVTGSSEAVSFPASNVLSDFRSKPWKPSAGVQTFEYLNFDLGLPMNPTFFGAVWDINEASGLSENAVVTLRASNVVEDFESAPFIQTLTVHENGLFQFLDLGGVTDNQYRYWQLRIEDNANFDFYNKFRLGYVYLGDHFTFTNTNVAQGFQMTVEDPSVRQQSEGGQLYFQTKEKYTRFSSMQTQLLRKNERDEFQQLFFDLGVSTPFFISIDPAASISNDLADLTKFAIIDGSPQFTHVFLEYFNMSFSMREVV